MIENSFFLSESSNILIVVPHQDDELNLCGSLYHFFAKKHNVTLLFVTNGNKHNLASERINEAVNVAKKIGGNISIKLLGYPDSYYSNEYHLYNIDYQNEKQTSGTELIPEFSFEKRGCHSQVNYQMLLKDLYDLIIDLKPDCIFFNGNDSHIDHKMTYLAVLEVLDRIVVNDGNYMPNCYCGFTYETAYNAPKDYYCLNFKETVLTSVMKKEKIPWSLRIRFPVSEGFLTYRYSDSVLFKLLSEYKSQNMVMRFFSIQNSDHVFWKIPSLLFIRLIDFKKSNIDASLVSFIPYVYEDINNEMSKKYTFPEKKESIKIAFKEPIKINKIILLGRFDDEYAKRLRISCSDDYENHENERPELLLCSERYCVLAVNRFAKRILIKLNNAEDYPYRLFFDSEDSLFRICKICFDDNFIYSFKCLKNLEYSFSIYSNFYASESAFRIELDGKEISTLKRLSFSKNGTHSLRIIHKEYSQCFDEVEICVGYHTVLKIYICLQSLLLVIKTKGGKIKKDIIFVLVKIKHFICRFCF